MGRKKDIELPDKIVAIILLATAVGVIGDVLGLSASLIESIVAWILSTISGIIASWLAEVLVEAISRDLLKKIAIEIEIYKNIKISFTVFFFATIVVRYTLFANL
jgi:hypothetical protein